jgi:hypothetical protein
MMSVADAVIRAKFPKLQNDAYKITREPTGDYNCIGWAAGDSWNWWWPSPDDYWPDDVPRVNTIENFILAFRTLGYERCDNGNFESQYEKVALYAIADVPQHMARQLPSGMWVSKLGPQWDIQHAAADSVENSEYGQIVLYMRRPRFFQQGLHGIKK